MTVGIAGLGLIGGSMAKAYHEAGWSVYADDIDDGVLGIAQLNGVVEKTLDAESIPTCDLVLLALYPQASVDWLQTNAQYLSKDCTVIDCCGVKEIVCDAAFPLAMQYGFSFFGGHPMAGTQFSGYRHSRASLFRGASMILIPPRYDDPALIEHAEKLLAPAGFGRFTVTTASEHDRMIAFTSQLAHIVSNAYIKSPTAGSHRGFSAGSYKDMTRVAWLNETMWTELFLENREHLLNELDTFIQALDAYRMSLQTRDREALRVLLAEGRVRKEEVDGR